MTHLSHPVITQAQARAIVGNREPLLPAEFVEACKLLQECRELDEAKYWSDKASALAAWAKVYHSTRIAREARLLKLHAYRRMAQLAKDIKKMKGTSPAKTLTDQGMTKWEADEVMAVGRASPKQFEEAINAVAPPAPSYFKRSAIAFNGSVGNAMRAFHYFTQRVDATEMAAQVPPKEGKHYKRMAESIADWIDEFDQHLKGDTE